MSTEKIRKVTESAAFASAERQTAERQTSGSGIEDRARALPSVLPLDTLRDLQAARTRSKVGEGQTASRRAPGATTQQTSVPPEDPSAWSRNESGARRRAIAELAAGPTRLALPGGAPRLSADCRVLDLTGLTYAETAALPPEVTNATRDQITVLRLPAGAVSIPDWTAALPKLERLDLRAYPLTVLKAGHPGLKELHIDIAAVRIVEVTAGTKVYCRGLPMPREKVRVIERDPSTGEIVRESAALGHAYFVSGHDGRVNYENLNGKATFPSNGRPISCRHLATDHVRALQAQSASRQVQRFADAWIERRGSARKIAMSVRPETEERYDELLHHAPDDYLVGHGQWGAFMRTRFASLRPGMQKHYLVVTPLHAMSLDLAVKNVDGALRYCATLYDPNDTLTRRRIVEDDLDQVGRWQADTWIDGFAIFAYYGRPSPNAAPSIFIAVPNEFHSHPIRYPLFAGHGRRREITEFLDPAERASAGTAHQLFQAWHVTEDRLRAKLALCNTPKDKAALLAAESSAGIPGVFVSFASGDAQAIRALGAVASSLRDRGELTNAQLFDLLCPTEPSSGFSGLEMAMIGDRASAIRALRDAIDNAFSADRLVNARVFRLLSALSVTDDPGLWAAMLAGRTETIRAYGELLGNEKIVRCLNGHQLETLLAARTPEEGFSIGGEPALLTAMCVDNADSVYAYGDVLIDLAPVLTHAARFRLFQGSNKDGATALVAAVMLKQASSVLAYGDIVVRAGTAGWLTQDQVVALLGARPLRGASLLSIPMETNQVPTVRAYGEILLRAYAAGIVTNQQLFHIVQGSDVSGSGLARAIKTSSVDAILAFGDWLGDPRLRDAFTPNQVAAFLAEGRQALSPGRLHAPDEAVRAWRVLVIEAYEAGSITIRHARHLLRDDA